MIPGKITTHCPTILSLRKAPRGDDDNRAFSNTCGSWALERQRQEEGSAGASTRQLLTHLPPTTCTPGWTWGYTLVGRPRRCTSRFPIPETSVHLQGNGHTTNSVYPGMGVSIAPLPHNRTVLPVVWWALHTCWWKNTAWFWKGRSWMKMHHTLTHTGCDFHGAKTLTRADTLFFPKELFSYHNKNDGAGKTTLPDLRYFSLVKVSFKNSLLFRNGNPCVLYASTCTCFALLPFTQF